MFTLNWLLLFGVLAFQAVDGHRIIRSPDKMELEVPNRSFERDSGEYQENMKEEQAYWQGQGDKLGDREQDGHQLLDEEREKNQENYEHEKEYYQEQQNNNYNDMNETYQGDREKAEAQHQANHEHYHEHHQTTYEPGKHTENLHSGKEIGDRYEEKGEKHMNDGQDKMENYHVNGNSPSFTYTRD